MVPFPLAVLQMWLNKPGWLGMPVCVRSPVSLHLPRSALDVSLHEMTKYRGEEKGHVLRSGFVPSAGLGI